LIPFTVLLLVWAVWPSWGFISGMDFAFIYHRFAILTLPLYALLFRPATAPDAGFQQARTIAAVTVIILSCWTYLGVQSTRMNDFGKESAEFDPILAAAEPGHHALYLTFDGASLAANNTAAYRHYPAWYQAEAQGNVEFNFAHYRNQVVIYRSNKLEAIPKYGSSPGSFQWRKDAGDSFYYIFTRGELPENFFAEAGCPISKLATSGLWALYRGCGQH
jgi:hypothetical protein